MSQIINEISAERIQSIADYADSLFKYAFPRVRDESTAEDLVQETLLAAIQNHGSFSGSSSVGTWLVGILKHKIIDHFRRSSWFIDMKEQAEDEMFDEMGHWREQAIPGAWNETTPEDHLEQKELARVLKDCLAALPKHLLTIFAMREIEGLGREEICEILGLSSSNYWVMLHRARLRLRHEFELRSLTVKKRGVQPKVDGECLKAA
jgi:RNA polymerase sigma-70 factor (TIGR02943 family)